MDRAFPQILDNPAVTTDIADVADLIIAYLQQIGVDYVFGVPGGAIEPLYNALARSERRGGIRSMTARHEAGAAFMADGYARDTGKLGVCIATSGPGATNLITGVACAYDNSVPMLAITGQPPLPSHGRRALQESGCTGINIPGMFEHCTRYNTSIVHTSQAETKIVAAIMQAFTANGPSHLSIPVDIQRDHWNNKTPTYDLRRLIGRSPLMDIASVELFATALLESKKTVFLVGGGCGDAINAILALIARVDGRFITTPDGKGLVSARHPLYRGVFGFAGHQSASDLLREMPDLVVVIGTRLGEWTSAGWSESLLNERLIHIDSSEEHFNGSPMAQLHVQGHIRSIIESTLDMLNDAVASDVSIQSTVSVQPTLPTEVDIPQAVDDGLKDAPNCSSRLTTCTEGAEQGVSVDAKRMSPVDLMRALSKYAPPGTRVVADAGNSTAWAIHYLELQDRPSSRVPLPGVRNNDILQDFQYRPHSWLHVLMDFAPMGWAIGAAVGMAAADRNSGVVCLTGDGSYLMNGQEITVAQSENLAVVFVILNDAALGMVKHGQRLAGAEPTAFALPNVDYAALAKSMGINAYIINNVDDMDRLNFSALLCRRGPTLLDVRIDSEVMPPIGMRLKALGTVE